MKLTTLIFLLLTAAFQMVGSFTSIASDDKPVVSVLRGVIVDAASGEELTGASIKISGTDLVVYSEADGTFTLDLTTSALNERIELVITLVSFETISVVVSDDRMDSPAVFALSEK